MKEAGFKSEFLGRLSARCAEEGVELEIIPKNPLRSRPDTVILGKGAWATLEFKRSKDADHQPNQDYHILRLNKMGYAAFVYPENSEEVFGELERLFIPT